MKKRIGIAYGGYSSEWVISEKSAEVVQNHLNKEIYEPVPVLIEKDGWWAVRPDGARLPMDRNDFSFTEDGQRITFDAVFNAIHGTPGEDGTLQGYFDMLGIPTTSAGVLSAALTFSKSYCNGFLRQYDDVHIADSVLLRKGESLEAEALLQRIGLPCFVKPNNMGSSFGITKLKDAAGLEAALEKAFEEDDEAVVERFVQGTEVGSGVFLQKGEVVALPLTEIVSKNEFFDFQAKYEGASDEITPARISDELTARVQATTVNVFKRLRLTGMARMDYIIQDGKPYLIEVNTVPGLSEASILPQQVVYSGMTLGAFFDALVAEALS